MSDDTDPLMMLVWIIPIVIFVFYGQQIQLLVTSGEIKKAIKKLDKFRSDSKKELIDYVKKNLEMKKQIFLQGRLLNIAKIKSRK